MASSAEQVLASGVGLSGDPAKINVEVGQSAELDAVKALGYKAELQPNRSMFTLLFQSLAISAIPYGFGSPLISAIYGGGQLPMFLGWILVLVVDECVALSLGELASRYPTSAGPYYWSFQLADAKVRTLLSFVTGWASLIGNWTITLSVNFGFASLIAASISLYQPNLTLSPYQLLLVFYGVCLLSFVVVAFGNRHLPVVDTLCAAFTAISILVTLVCLSATAKVGRNSLSDTLGHYDTTLSGWGNWSFFIGLLPAAYTFSALGMISSMAEECGDATVKLPKAMAWCVPVGGMAGLFLILPICATMPDAADIIISAPEGQALPYIYAVVMGSPGGGLALTSLVLIVALFCSISITVAASRCTWAFARDQAIPLSGLWARVDKRHGTPVNALALMTAVQMLLGLINLGNSSAFLAFVSVGVMALAVSYGIPVGISMVHGRREVANAPWRMPQPVGWVVNVVAVLWTIFETVLFSMPTTLPTTATVMNYAIVVFAAFMALSAVYYVVFAHKVYKGPPESDPLKVDSSPSGE